MTDTVLITGGFGYVGGRIARTLDKYPEFLLRLSTRESKPNPPTWLERGSIVTLDIMSDEEIDFACRGVRYIVHLAALNEIDSTTNPEQALIINSLGTLKLLRAAERAGVERFIYFSTAHVYGAPLVGKITEQTIPRPVHPYAITHRTAEDFVLAANHRQGLLGIVLRLSNGVGSPAHANVNRWTLVANDLCRQAVTTRKLILRSTGLQMRDFITLTDIGRAVMHFIRLPASDCDNGLFNLGSECSLRIIDMAERIASRCIKMMGFTPPILRPEPVVGEASDFLEYSIEKLKATGFNLLGDFDGEIDATLRLCQKLFTEVSFNE